MTRKVIVMLIMMMMVTWDCSEVHLIIRTSDRSAATIMSATLIMIKKIGVLQDTARAPQPPSNQPTGHQMSQQGLYVPKKAYFGPNLAVFGPKV